ncbi:MAG: SDR family NAD(P)-dependent oxidoreductase [Alphaproteobacteria bacterium]|nr:SDR family NAD(P)-dependent oxidoreductase [Alphaproteobacteria bacterium]
MAEIKLPDIDLDGRVVIMTGADRGLGRAMSLGLAEAGARLVLASPATEGLKKVAEDIREIAGAGHALAVETDITDLGSCRACLARTIDAFGAPYVLVNNARRLHRGPGLPASGNSFKFWETNPRIYKESVEVNVTGTFFMAFTVAPTLIGQGHGKIINLTTSVHNFSGPRNSPYGVTKAAIDAETYIWAKDLAGTGVSCNALLPGGACDSDPERVKKPGRTYLPVDVMNPVLVWLCSARSDGHTGGRFNGSLWDPSLDPDAAGAACRETAAFRGVD